jgi:hypothetical protein
VEGRPCACCVSSWAAEALQNCLIVAAIVAAAEGVRWAWGAEGWSRDTPLWL